MNSASVYVRQRGGIKKITGLKESQEQVFYLLEVYKNLTNGSMELKTVMEANE